MKQASKICFCFRTHKSCLSIFSLLVFSISVILFFIFPSPPKVSLSDPYIPKNGRFLVNGRLPGPEALQEVTSGRPFEISLQIATNVTAFNTAFVQIYIRSITLDIDPIYKTERIVDFRGTGLVEDLAFNARVDTEFVFPITLSYVTKLQNLYMDPVINLLRENCLADPQVPINSVAEVHVAIDAISWTGWVPTVKVEKSIQCPPSEDLNDFIQLATQNRAMVGGVFQDI